MNEVRLAMTVLISYSATKCLHVRYIRVRAMVDYFYMKESKT